MFTAFSFEVEIQGVFQVFFSIYFGTFNFIKEVIEFVGVCFVRKYGGFVILVECVFDDFAVVEEVKNESVIFSRIGTVKTR